jgi:transglutaminase-like putative cysteine protease
MVTYQILHQTDYHYREGVTISHHAARLAPRGLELQECEDFSLVVRPRPALEKTRLDFFGNEIHFFSIQELHQELHIRAASRVRVRPRWERNLAESPPWESVVRVFSEPVLPENVPPYQFVFDSHLIQVSPELADYARPSFPVGRPLAEGAYDLCQRIHRDFAFNPKATTVATPLAEVIRTRQGVCQDFAHVGIACLRSLGLPARYVSGYIRTVPPEGQRRLVGADASHAWLSLFCPVLGWVDMDPTNQAIPSQDHITVAFGRDFADVSPVAGVLTGGGEHQVTVAVDVQVVPTDVSSE